MRAGPRDLRLERTPTHRPPAACHLGVARKAGHHLRIAHDWHEHDGYVTTATPTTWDDLAAAVANDEAFLRWSPEDDLVRRAWLADDGSFYLRWFMYDERSDLTSADPPVGGDVDLTGRSELVEAGREALAELGVGTEVAPASAFFRSRWAG